MLTGIVIGIIFTLAWQAKAQAHPRPLPTAFVAGAKCIHSHEGSWHDGDAPYWGGLQMDYAFQQRWAPRLLRRKGTADNWTPHQQLHVAYRAFRVLGWSPWPGTRRMCGL